MEFSEASQVIDVEPGWMAASALDRVRSPELGALMTRASFRGTADWDWVPVAPCEACQDGGLRVAGTVRVRNAWRLVRACDTCGAVTLSESSPRPPSP
jgi:hypothetical protein